jgi:hypothetical protein
VKQFDQRYGNEARVDNSRLNNIHTMTRQATDVQNLIHVWTACRPAVAVSASMSRRVVDMSPSHELSRSKENVRRYSKLSGMRLKRRRKRLRYEDELETSGTDDVML